MEEIIQLRAWDGLNEKFTYWTMNDLCTYANKDEKPSALDRWELYTGLKDRNGKRIFEGDIIEGNWGNEGSLRVGEIKFYEGAFRFVSKKSNLTGEILSFDEHYKNSEVIGNIYQNANLII